MTWKIIIHKPYKKHKTQHNCLNHMWYYKTIVVGLQGREKSLMISLSVLIQYRRVTDRQTDRHVASVVSEIFNVKKCHNLEIHIKGHSRSLKVVPFDRLCMISC